MNAQRVATAIALLMWVCSAAESKGRPGDLLFSDTTVARFEIQIAANEFEKLQRDNRRYVRATVQVGTNTLHDVGVRLKGHGSFRPLQDKPSLTLNFNEFKRGQKLDGLTKVLLNNASQDTSLMSEYIAAGMFRDAGVPVARVSHARVQLHGRDLGFYVLAEGMDKVFLQHHFGKASGALYDANAIDIDRPLQQSNGRASDQGDVAALVAAARRPPAERAQALADVLDTDRFLSFLAISVLGAQHDSYPLNRNNYRLYRDPASQRFVMMPHGIDGSFSRFRLPIALAPNFILTRAIVETPALAQAYRERLALLFTNVFRLDVLTNRIQKASLRLQSVAPNETVRASLALRAHDFARRVVERHQNVAEQLAGISPKLLALDRGARLHLTNWLAEMSRGTASFEPSALGGKRDLHILTGADNSSASWRQRLLLSPGAYRFQAKVRLAAPASPIASGSGVAIRISGRSATLRVPAAGEWTALEFPFAVRQGEEDVQFICECRGSNLQACFELDSLVVRRE